MINLYIGFDSSNYGQELAFEVCKRSVEARTKNINIYKLDRKVLIDNKIYFRDNEDGSTEFTYTRFLVPLLNNYQDFAIFCDSDFLWRCDLSELSKYFDKNMAVACVKHEYLKCLSDKKMDGLKQEWYPCKNWSSLMIFNCAHPDCKNLNSNSVSIQSPKWLHRMEWTNEKNINPMDKTFNYLLGYYDDIEEPKALHLTDGGPWHVDWYKKKIPNEKKYEYEWMNYLKNEEITNLTKIIS